MILKLKRSRFYKTLYYKKYKFLVLDVARLLMLFFFRCWSYLIYYTFKFKFWSIFCNRLISSPV